MLLGIDGLVTLSPKEFHMVHASALDGPMSNIHGLALSLFAEDGAKARSKTTETTNQATGLETKM